MGTTNYLYDGEFLINETDNAGSLLSKYLTSTNVDEPLAQSRGTTLSYYQQDGLGSISTLTNPESAITNSYVYDSFGEPTAATGTVVNQVRYTGREFDAEIGMYQYRSRYYDASLGRFISEDSVHFDGGIDFYAYAANSPTNLIDPSGFWPEWWDRIVTRLLNPYPSTFVPIGAGGNSPDGTIHPFRCTISGECDFTPEMQAALDCFRDKVGRQPTITCGRGRHNDTDPHMRGLAVDIGHGSNPWLFRGSASSAFKDCFPSTSYAQEEWNDQDDHDKGTHYHIQYSPGRGGASGFAPGIK